MKLSWKVVTLAAFIGLIPLVLYSQVYAQLPAQVATHFDFSGQANGFTSREQLWIPLGVPLALVPCLALVPQVDPRGKSYEKLGGFYPVFVVGMTLFLSALMTILVLNGLPGMDLPVEKLTLGAVGLVFLLLGNYMPKMKQSYTMGIKTPWTLHSEVVWNKTHRIAGPCFMVAGLVMMLGVFCASGWRIPLLTASVCLAAGVPTFMSYVYYKKLQ